MIGSGVIGSVPLGSIPSTGTVSAAPAVLRIGADDTVAKYLKLFSARLRKQLNGRDVFEFVFLVKDGYRPKLGEEVVMTRGGVRHFAGTINDKKERLRSAANFTSREITIRCVDWHSILDRRTIVRAYEETWAGDIVRDFVAYLADEGLTEGSIQQGFLMPRANWNHEHIATAIEDLCKVCGYYAFVDYEKRLHFLPREASTAPFGISEHAGVGVTAAVRDCTTSESLNDYRNTQVTKGWKEVTAPQTQRLKGDGTTRTWTLEFEVLEVPTARRNDGTPLTVGISGVEKNKDIYWNKNQKEISQEQSQEPLPDGAYIDVTYIGTFAGIAKQSDTTEIAARRAIEGGTGIYEAVEVDASLEGSEVVIAHGAAQLARNKLEAQADFELFKDGLDIGQLLSVHYPSLGLSNQEMLITSIEVTDFTLTKRRYRISCTTGEAKNAFKDFWMTFARTGQKVGVREGEIVEYPVPLEDGLALTDALTVTPGTAHIWEIGVDEVGLCEVG